MRKILFSGGGTMGSVSPLVAVYVELKEQFPKAEFLFVGTKFGPERAAVESYKIPFIPIESGKLRRYHDWRNYSDPFRILIGFFQSLGILIKFRPNVVMVAGAFVGVPLAWAARLLNIPVLIHHQDIEVGLANILMANVAKKITVSFPESLKDFSQKKTVWTGNAVRSEFVSADKSSGQSLFKLRSDLPTLLITGGSTGSAKINEMAVAALPRLLKHCQVIHLTGRGKKVSFEAENYHQFEFLTNEMPEAIMAADLIVNRAGLSTLSELAVAAKPAIIIPIYGTHQEYNARYFQKHNAIVVMTENGLNGQLFADVVADLLSHPEKLSALSKNIGQIMPRDGAKKIAGLLAEIAR